MLKTFYLFLVWTNIFSNFFSFFSPGGNNLTNIHPGNVPEKTLLMIRGCRYLHSNKNTKSGKKGNYIVVMDVLGQIIPAENETPLKDLSEATFLEEPVKVSNPHWVETNQGRKEFRLNKNSSVGKIITCFDRQDDVSFYDYGKVDTKSGQDPPMNGRAQRKAIPAQFSVFANSNITNIIKSSSRDIEKPILLYRKMTTDLRHPQNRTKIGNSVINFGVVSTEDQLESGFLTTKGNGKGTLSAFDWHSNDAQLKYQGDSASIDIISRLLLKINQISERDLDINFNKACVAGVDNCSKPNKAYLMLNGCLSLADNRSRARRAGPSDRERSPHRLVINDDESQDLFAE